MVSEENDNICKRKVRTHVMDNKKQHHMVIFSEIKCETHRVEQNILLSIL